MTENTEADDEMTNRERYEDTSLTDGDPTFEEIFGESVEEWCEE